MAGVRSTEFAATDFEANLGIDDAELVYRSVLYTYDAKIREATVYDAGLTSTTDPTATQNNNGAEPPDSVCADDPSGVINTANAPCAGFAGADALIDLQVGGATPVATVQTDVQPAVAGFRPAYKREWVEVILASSATGADATKRDVAHTQAMDVADLDGDGRFDILYATNADEAARTSLARPKTESGGTTKPPYVTTPAVVNDANAKKELPLDVVNELNAIKSSFLGMLDSLLAAKASAVSVDDRDAQIDSNAAYPGETSRGVINRGECEASGCANHPNVNDLTTPHMRPALKKCEACTKDAKDDGTCTVTTCGYYGAEWYSGNENTQSQDYFESTVAEAAGTTLLPNTPTPPVTCPATDEPVTPVTLDLQVDFPVVPCKECVATRILKPIFGPQTPTQFAISTNPHPLLSLTRLPRALFLADLGTLIAFCWTP